MGRRIRTTLAALCIAGAAATAVAAPTAAGATPAGDSPAAETAAGAYCDVTITLIAQWTTGHGAVVLVRNTSAVPVRWSRLELRFPGPVFSAQVWSGSVTQAGSTATIVPWPGGVLQPGQTATVGIFYAAGSGTTPAKYEVVCAPA